MLAFEPEWGARALRPRLKLGHVPNARRRQSPLSRMFNPSPRLSIGEKDWTKSRCRTPHAPPFLPQALNIKHTLSSHRTLPVRNTTDQVWGPRQHTRRNRRRPSPSVRFWKAGGHAWASVWRCLGGLGGCAGLGWMGGGVVLGLFGRMGWKGRVVGFMG